jgi:glycosyltransferase involved in cell wall biosynthesis
LLSPAATTQGNALISIVLPTYNGARFLEAAIQSCLSQSYANLELIVVDDASTDGTPEIVARFAASDSRVIAARHEANQKLPAALNTGFGLAHGDFFTWTSDDNLYEPDALEKLKDCLLSEPAVDIVYSDYLVIDEHGKEARAVAVRDAEDLGYFGNCIGACFLFRRAVYEQLGGYDRDFFLAEDYDFWRRAAELFRFRALHRTLCRYRMHDGSLSARRRADVNDATERLLRRFLEIAPRDDAGRSRRAGLIVHLAYVDEWRGNRRLARRHALEALLAAPFGVWRRNSEFFLALWPFPGRFPFWLLLSLSRIMERSRRALSARRQEKVSGSARCNQ